mgnify:CR=1 FL=1
MGEPNRSRTAQRIISAVLAMVGGAMLWITYTGTIPWITYTGEIPDGPLALILGGIFLFTGLYGIYDPDATVPTSPASGGGGSPP